MKQVIESENLNIKKVVPVLAQDVDFDGEYTAHAFGLETLLRVTSEVLPDELQDSFQNVQIADPESKKERAHAVVAAAVAAAAAEGAIPIPFSDCAVLIPTQVAMIASITVIYGMEVNKSFLTSFVSATIGTAGATVLGKTIVTNLIKLIPGGGTIAGGAISGATAGLLTSALGEAYIVIMDRIFRGEMKKEDLYGGAGLEEMKRIFREKLKKK
jgi:uncharacterized protein (DUF697 family)